MMLCYRLEPLAIISCALSLASISAAQISLGSAATFGVVAANDLMNTGLTVINGDVAVTPGSPGTSISGFPPGIITGAVEVKTPRTRMVRRDVLSAFNMANGMPVNTDLTGQDLAGLTLPAGVYQFDSSATLTGELTLDAQGDPNALFVIIIRQDLTTAAASTVLLRGGANPCNVFFPLRGANFGPGTIFVGNVLSYGAITAQEGSSFRGGLYSIGTDTTLTDAVIETCSGFVAPPVNPAPSVTPPVISITPTVTPTLPVTLPSTSVPGLITSLVPSVTLSTEVPSILSLTPSSNVISPSLSSILSLSSTPTVALPTQSPTAVNTVSSNSGMISSAPLTLGSSSNSPSGTTTPNSSNSVKISSASVTPASSSMPPSGGISPTSSSVYSSTGSPSSVMSTRTGSSLSSTHLSTQASSIVPHPTTPTLLSLSYSVAPTSTAHPSDQPTSRGSPSMTYSQTASEISSTPRSSASISTGSSSTRSTSASPSSSMSHSTTSIASNPNPTPSVSKSSGTSIRSSIPSSRPTSPQTASPTPSSHSNTPSASSTHTSTPSTTNPPTSSPHSGTASPPPSSPSSGSPTRSFTSSALQSPTSAHSSNTKSSTLLTTTSKPSTIPTPTAPAVHAACQTPTDDEDWRAEQWKHYIEHCHVATATVTVTLSCSATPSAMDGSWRGGRNPRGGRR